MGVWPLRQMQNVALNGRMTWALAPPMIGSYGGVMEAARTFGRSSVIFSSLRNQSYSIRFLSQPLAHQIDFVLFKLQQARSYSSCACDDINLRSSHLLRSTMT